MKTLKYMIPVVLVLAACGGNQQKKERIGGIKSPADVVARQEKIVAERYSEAFLMGIREKLTGRLDDLGELKKISKKEFSPLIALGMPQAIKPIKADRNADLGDAGKKELEKPTISDPWGDVKILEIRANGEAGEQATGITIRLKIKDQSKELVGALNPNSKSNGLFAKLTLSPNEADLLADTDSGILKNQLIEAKSVCIMDNSCTRILSIIRIGDTHFKVVVTDRQEVKKNSRSEQTSKTLKAGAIDIHYILGDREDHQMAIYLKFDSTADETITLLLDKEGELDLHNLKFVSENDGSDTKVSFLKEGQVIRIFNLDSTVSDDLWLDVDQTKGPQFI